jgi:hypothetical protein
MTNQTTNKSFILHKDSLSVLNKLSDDEAGKLFKAIFEYQKEKILPKNNLISIVFEPFLNQFIRDEKNYKQTCEARKLAGSLGGKQKLANASKSKQKVANLADNDSKNKNDNKNKKDFTPPTLQEIQNYCIERNNQIDPAKFFDYYNAGNWSDAKGNKIKNWKQKIITWENKTTGGGSGLQSDTKNLCELINKMAGASYLRAITTVNNNAVLHFKSLADREKLRSLENIQ